MVDATDIQFFYESKSVVMFIFRRNEYKCITML